MFQRKENSKIKVVMIMFVIIFIVIIGRVIYIELFEYSKLNSLANDLWSRDLPIEGDRGLILDRNGIVLADNITTTSLVLVPNQITNKELVSKELSKILHVTKEEMDRHVYKNVSIERVHPEGRRVKELENEINGMPSMTKFDDMTFKKLVSKIIIGEYDSNNNFIPNVVKFILKVKGNSNDNEVKYLSLEIDERNSETRKMSRIGGK